MLTTKPGALAPGVCLLSSGAYPNVFRSGGFQLWAELPALAPGARCRLRHSVGSGSSAHSWLLLREASINGATESRCSHDDPGSGCQQGLQHCTTDTGLHGRQQGFMKGFTTGSEDVSVLHRPAKWRVPETAIFQAGRGTSQAHHHWPEGLV
jgi:hypothetical protein